jgi:hypothetical protein
MFLGPNDSPVNSPILSSLSVASNRTQLVLQLAVLLELLSPGSVLFPLPDESRTRVLLAGVSKLLQLDFELSSATQGFANASGDSLLLVMRMSKGCER